MCRLPFLNRRCAAIRRTRYAAQDTAYEKMLDYCAKKIIFADILINE